MKKYGTSRIVKEMQGKLANAVKSSPATQTQTRGAKTSLKTLGVRPPLKGRKN